MAVRALQTVTPQEYLAWERKAETKSEYFDGVIMGMAGASWEHNLITSNLGRSLGNRFAQTSCIAVTSDLRVRVPACNNYYYPDVVVVCGEPRFEDSELDTLLNPILIIEVLSESTEKIDRNEKLDCYRLPASLEVCVLVAQDRPRAERYARLPEGTWSYDVTKGLEATLRLDAVGCELPPTDIYARVEFPARPEDSSAQAQEERGRMKRFSAPGRKRTIMPKTLTPADIPTPPETAPNRIRWTRQQCEAIRDAEILTGRYELIDGEIISKMGQKPPHAYAIRQLMAWLFRLFGAETIIVQSTIDLSETSPEYDEPEPDLAVTTQPASAYAQSHPGPSDLLLVVEVSDTTLRFDRTTKAALYARAGVREYWVADLVGRQIYVHRQPASEGYVDITTYGAAEMIATLARPDAAVCVADLLPPTT